MGVAVTSLAMSRAFAQASSVRLRMLIVNQPATARKVADLLAQGESFVQLASEYSVHPTKQHGGLLGLVALDDLQEQVRAMVGNLQVGQYTGPIPMPEGLAFFQRTTMAHYAEALRLMRSGTYQAALASLAKDLALNPDRVHSLELKAYALERLRRKPEAETVYREIIRQAPKNVLAHNNLGALLDQEGRHAEAAKLFERVIMLDPAQHVTLYNLAWLYAFELPNLTKALAYIQQAIAWKPDAARYYAVLGDIYKKQGKWEQARIAAAKAAALEPQHTKYQDRLAELGKAGSALKSKRPAVRLQSDSDRNTVLSQTLAPTVSIKVVVLPGGADTSHQVIRLLQQNGFPIALRITDPKPMNGLRIYHKPHAIETAQKLRDLIKPDLQLRRLTWKTQFDIIVYVGQKPDSKEP